MEIFNGTFKLAKPTQKDRLLSFFLTRRTVEEMAGDFDVSPKDSIYPSVVKHLEKYKKWFVNGKDIYREDCVDDVCDMVMGQWKIEEKQKEKKQSAESTVS